MAAKNWLIRFSWVFAALFFIGLGIGINYAVNGNTDDADSFDDRNNVEVISEANTPLFLSKMRGVSPTLSGFSGGGYMACLVHTVLSKTFIGTASIAGAPYASILVNHEDGNEPVEKLLEFARSFNASGQIDDLGNLNNSKVFVLHAEIDELVPVHLGRKIKPYYDDISDSVDVVEDIGRNFGHIFPTADGEPIKILNHLYSKNLSMVSSGIYGPKYSEFSMKGFCPDNDCNSAGMHDTAFLAASENCRNGTLECPVHVYLHGCTLSSVLVGTWHMRETFYANIAEEHDFIVLFLQTTVDDDACWNAGWRTIQWFVDRLEDSDEGHLTYENPQVSVMKGLVDNLLASN